MGLQTLLPILGFSALFARLLGTKLSVAMLHAVSAIILVLYVGGLAQVLWWTALAVHLAGVGLLIYELWRLSRNGDQPKVSIPIAVLALCVAFFWLVHRNSLYMLYDEYSHWGIYIKEMLALDGFWLADTNSLHPRYPPAAPLWQYLFNVFREPSEGTTYLAQFLLLLTPLLVLWERIAWRRGHWMVLILALCLVAVTNFGVGISTVYVDHVIGAWFVGTILCFVMDSPTWRRGMVYALPLATLALLKESSFAFSLAAAAILGLLVWFQSWNHSGRPATSAVRALLTVAIITLPAVLCLRAWEWRLDHMGMPNDLEAVGDIVSGMTGDRQEVDAEQGAEITRRFLEVFSEQQLSNDSVSSEFNGFVYETRELFTDRYRLSTLGLFVTFSIWWIGLTVLVLRGPERRIWGIVASGVALTGIAYLVALYLTYRFAAGEYGLLLSSYTRYARTIALPMLIVCFAPLLPAFRGPEPERAWRILGRSAPRHSILALVGCVGLYVFETPYLRPVFEKNAVDTLRPELEPIAAAIHSAVGRSSVWLYLPNDYENRFVGHLFQYLMTPTPIHVERARAFLDREPSEVLEDWSKFDYVWLPSEVNAEIANRFAEVTGLPLIDRLFLVSTDESGKTRLEPLTSQIASSQSRMSGAGEDSNRR
jgi:hypothetical protein